MLGEVFVGLRATGFDDSHVEAGLGQALCGPSAGCAGADYKDIKICWGIGSGHLRESDRDRRGSDAVFYKMDASKRGRRRQRKKLNFRRVKVLLDAGSEW